MGAALAPVAVSASASAAASSSASSASKADLSDIKEVSIRFVTSLSSLSSVLPSSPFTVPVRLSRYGLSRIVNHLLQLERARPFDFLIDGAFLRSSLLQHLRRAGHVGESGLTAEVVEAMAAAPVSSQAARLHPDWLSAVAAVDGGQQAATGCYDGSVRLLRGLGQGAAEQEVVAGSGHSGAVKCLRVLRLPAADGGWRLLSGGKDCTVRVWECESEAATELRCCFQSRQQAGSVEALAVVDSGGGLSDGGGRFVSAGWDRQMLLWQLSRGEEEAEPAAKARRLQPGSRAAAASSSPPALSPLCALPAASDAVTGLACPFPTALFCCSLDSSLRQTDLSTGQQLRVWWMGGGKALQAVDVSSDCRWAAVGSWDGGVRIVDCRAAAEAVTAVLRSHCGLVASVSCSPLQPFHVCSGAYDGSVKLWDIRAAVPLSTIALQQGEGGGGGKEEHKVLSVQWSAAASQPEPGDSSDSGGSVILSGGSDRVLHLHRLS